MISVEFSRKIVADYEKIIVNLWEQENITC